MRKLFSIIVFFLFLGCGNVSEIDKILALEDKTEIILAIDKMLWEKAKNDKNFESLNTYEKNVLFINTLEAEINNGGFNQYFYNASGEYTYETILALRAIKASNTEEILMKALNIFPKQPVPKDITQRREVMEHISDEIQDTWNALDNKFYAYPDSLGTLLIEYIKTNKDQF